MNNNEMNFDPLTGQSIKKEESIVENGQNAASVTSTQEQTASQQDLQSIATVDQSNEKFINNTQSSSKENTNSSDGKMNYAFIIILFIIIFASIVFLFPLISKYI